MSRLPYKVGIELTMMDPRMVKSADGYWDTNRSDHVVGRLERKLTKIGIKTWGLHVDAYCVEAASNPLSTWRQVEEYYRKVAGEMRRSSLTPQHPTITGGGGHLHVGPLSERLKVNLFRDALGRPYLPWVFNEPDDGLTSRSLVDVAGEPLFCMRNPMEYMYGSGYPFPSRRNRMIGYRTYLSTVEFRMFEAPLDWGEQKAHIEFVMAYLRWLSRTYRREWAPVGRMSQRIVSRYPLKRARNEFLALLGVLGLSEKPYKRMIKDNLVARYEPGRVRI